MTGEPARTDPESTSTDAGSDAVTEPGPTQSPTAAKQEPAKPGLPSIIVDPSLSQPDLPAVAAPVSEPPKPAPEPDFDALSADRFAAAYRPSWEGAAIPSTVAASVRAPSHHPSLAPEVSMAVADDEPLAPLSIATARRRGLLWMAGSVVGFVVLVYFGISSSTEPDDAAPPKAAIEAEPPKVPAPQAELPPTQPAPEPAPQPALGSAAPALEATQVHDAAVRSDSLPPTAAEPPPPPPPPAPTPAAVAAAESPAPDAAPPAARATPAPKAARKPAAVRVAKPAAKPAPRPKAKAKKGAGFVADSPY